MIRIDHKHESGKTCYVMDARFRNAQLVRFGDEIVGAAYRPYTGQWYAYDLETGEEIATFSRRFWEKCVAPLAANKLELDPDCVLT